VDSKENFWWQLAKGLCKQLVSNREQVGVAGG
jgi:hypothetical protein